MDKYIAVDLGAESGRIMIGGEENSKLRLNELYRFVNTPVQVGKHYFWDILKIFYEIKTSLNQTQKSFPNQARSLGVDSWALDFGLLDQNDNLLGNPYCYRDPRTERIPDKVHEIISSWDIYQKTNGIISLSINTVYQLYSIVLENPSLLKLTKNILLIPDLINYWLTGKKFCEYTNATVTRMFDSKNRIWSKEIIELLNIPLVIFPEVIMPGTNIGELSDEVKNETGMNKLSVIVPATHDTASAVIAVPAEEKNFVWLSSGTWSLLGTNSDNPYVTQEAMNFFISNYGSGEGKYLPWKNIMGLWLVQECRRNWAKESGELTYDDLTKLALGADAFKYMIDPDHSTFLNPTNMPAAIQDYCRNTNQKIPESKGEIIRTILEGLALKYRWTIEKLEKISNSKFDKIYIVGGGSKNGLLCQFAANACNRLVTAGPAEATAIGNIAMQMISTGQLSDLREARQLVKNSFDVKEYEPQKETVQLWQDAYARLEQLL